MIPNRKFQFLSNVIFMNKIETGVNMFVEKTTKMITWLNKHSRYKF